MGAARAKYFPEAWNVESKPCDFCTSAAAVVFCRADSAFMCIACDAKVHNGIQKHGRVWMCEVCEHAPAAVTCKADAAALCVDCDRDIHSANPLASRHDRVPVVPFYDSAELMMMKSATAAAVSFLVPTECVFADSSPTIDADRKIDSSVINSGFIADSSWISNTTPVLTSKFPADNPEMKAVDFLFSDDQFLDFDNYQICSQPYSDTAVVPVQTTVKPLLQPQLSHQPSPENRFEINFSKSNITPYNNSSFTTPSLSHSFSSSSMEVGVVPDGSAMSEISYPFAKSITSSTADQIGNQGSPAGGGDRRARVLRYKEKRKNRKFEKTIRYASRKAYAETRPRIKGRFAKRTDSEPDMDGVFGYGGGNYGADARYGVVPSY